MLTVVAVNNPEWSRQRAALNPAFATTALNRLIPVFESESDKVRRGLRGPHTRAESRTSP